MVAYPGAFQQPRVKIRLLPSRQQTLSFPRRATTWVVTILWAAQEQSVNNEHMILGSACNCASPTV
jgi:hypothetical protein